MSNNLYPDQSLRQVQTAINTTAIGDREGMQIMCQDYIFTKAWRIETSLGLIHVWMGEVVHQAKQTVEENLKTFLRGDGILSPQLILLYGSQSGCCYPPGYLQFQNLLFQFLHRHHHFPLLEKLWTPVTEKVPLLMSYDLCFSLMIVLVIT